MTKQQKQQQPFEFRVLIFLTLQKKRINNLLWVTQLGGFPHSSVGKESTCNAGDPGSIPESGRSSGEGIVNPLLYFGASLVAQLVKNLPAMWETLVQSLGREDSLEKGKATHSSILAWRIPWTVYATGSQKVGHVLIRQF